MIRTVRFDHLQRADSLIVIAKYFQQHIAARAGRKQDIVGFEQARIVRDQIFRFRSFELESAAQRASAPAQVDQIQLGVVVENNFVFQRRFDLSAGFEAYSLEHRIDVAQCLDPHFESEGHSQRAFTRSRTLQLHFLRVLVTRIKICGSETFFLALKYCASSW